MDEESKSYCVTSKIEGETKVLPVQASNELGAINAFTEAIESETDIDMRHDAIICRVHTLSSIYRVKISNLSGALEMCKIHGSTD